MTVTTTQPLAPPASEVARPASRRQANDEATRAFSVSMLISGVRCVLTYVVFPWILPAVGHAGGIGPGLGLAVGVIAITSNIFSIRRFQRSGHRWRWYISAINVAVVALLGYLFVVDLLDLLG